MPHRAVVRWIIRPLIGLRHAAGRLEGAFEQQVARISPPAAGWLHRHHAWLFRPVHFIASATMLIWGLQFWWLDERAFSSSSYAVVRLGNLDAEGVTMLLLALLLYVSPGWWLSTPIGRLGPLALVPPAAMVLAGGIMVGIGLTVPVTSLLHGGTGLAAAFLPAAIVVLAMAWRDAGAIGRLQVAQRVPAAEVRHAVNHA